MRGRIRAFLADLAGVILIAALFLAIYVATP